MRSQPSASLLIQQQLLLLVLMQAHLRRGKQTRRPLLPGSGMPRRPYARLSCWPVQPSTPWLGLASALESEGRWWRLNSREAHLDSYLEEEI